MVLTSKMIYGYSLLEERNAVVYPITNSWFAIV